MRKSKPMTHARNTSRHVIVTVVSLLLVTGSAICPAPLLAGDASEYHGGSHGIGIPGQEDNHAGTSCEHLGDLTAAAASWTDDQLNEQFSPADFLPPADFTILRSPTERDFAWRRSPGTGPPRRTWLRFTQSWPQAPPH